MRWVVAGFAVFLVVMAAGGWLGRSWFLDRLDAPGPLTEPAIVIIEPGKGVARIAQHLAQAGVIEESRENWIFAAAARYLEQERALKAGEYRFAPGVSLRDVIDKLSSGDTVLHTLTIPEGLTSREILALVKAEPLLTGEVDAVPPEGSLLPETYAFSRGDSRGAIINRMRRAMEQTIAELWDERAADLPLASPDEAIILASIVEKETGVKAERAKVAGVFLNRLRRNMPLQADPTVIFALTKGKAPLGRALLRSDWEYESPYNTYQNRGLPPGPIANPGRASLAATLNPASHSYLYFVADGQGGHAFAETLRQHNRNVAAWQRFQRARRAATP